jgi:prepilin-type N-terminal cleavage/methylation domain-containing protein
MEFSFWKKIITQNGFTLPEVMIGGAIIAGVALAGASLFKDQSRAQARVQHDQTLNQFHASLAKTFENSVNCNATLSPYYGLATVGATDLITDVRTCTTSKGSSTRCLEGATPADVTTAAPQAVEGRYIDQEGDGSFYNLPCSTCFLTLSTPPTPSTANTSRKVWTLTSIAPVAAVNKTGAFLLNVTYTLNPRIGVRTIRKQISLNVRFANGVFEECFNDQKSSISNLQNDVCRSLSSLSSTGIQSDGRVAYFDDKTQQCVLNSSLKNCTDQGLMVEGIRSDGTVHCRSITEGFNPSPSINGTSSSCSSSSSTAKLQWSGGQLKVVCTP